MAQEASFPTRPNASSFGPVKVDRRPPRLDSELGADEWGAARWTLGGLGQVSPLAVLVVAANGTITSQKIAWGSGPIAVTKTGTGVYDLAGPGLVTDNRGEQVAVAFVGALVSASRTSGSRRIAEWELVDADSITVRVYDSAGVAADGIFLVALF